MSIKQIVIAAVPRISLGERGGFKVDDKPVSFMHWERLAIHRWFFYAKSNGDRARMPIPKDVEMIDIAKWVRSIWPKIAEDVDTQGKSR